MPAHGWVKPVRLPFAQLRQESLTDHHGMPAEGEIALFGERTAHAGHHEAVQLAAVTGGPADVAAVRRYASRRGMSLNVEQQVSPDLGLFARAGLASGDVEPYEFTDIDRTIAAGLCCLASRGAGRPIWSAWPA
jgi:high affinity Mn2+ porin